MKRWILLPLLLTATPTFAGNWFGSGPWANGAYYPGQLDGRYFANVYNNLGGTFTRVSTTNTFFTTNQTTTTVISNGTPSVITSNVVTGPLFETNTVISGSVVSGVVSFGIRDGLPAAGTQSTAASSVSSFTTQPVTADPSLNNFLVYVNGDVYVGTTSANINPESSTVSGILANGAGRTRYQLFTNQSTGGGFGVANTGVEVISVPSASASGYFNANVNNNKATYTFAGGGTIAIATAVGGGSEVDGSHNFQLNGIKTSGNSTSAFPQTSSANPQQ
jgi:hypothetical protein